MADKDTAEAGLKSAFLFRSHLLAECKPCRVPPGCLTEREHAYFFMDAIRNEAACPAVGKKMCSHRTWLITAALLVIIPLQGNVHAQGWGFGRGDAPEYGDRVYNQPASEPPPYRAPNYVPPMRPRCRELEMRLNNPGGYAATAQEQIPRSDGEMRQMDAQYHRAQGEAERTNCYEDMFLFGRSLRRTPRCIELDQQAQSARARLEQLKGQRDALTRSSSPRGRREELVADLARNRCGDQYVREYEAQRSRSNSIFSFFSNEEPDDQASRYTPYGGASSTYRTLCVRECDGFYFPVSNETTPDHFQDDENKCRSQCASPAQLFYHRSDQDVDQMMSIAGQPYAQMPFAFRNRKVYIRGCSCNQAEYSRDEIAKSEEALKKGQSKRADASAPRAGDAAFARRISQAVQNAPEPQAAPLPAPPAYAPQQSVSAANGSGLSAAPPAPSQRAEN